MPIRSLCWSLPGLLGLLLLHIITLMTTRGDLVKEAIATNQFLSLVGKSDLLHLFFVTLSFFLKNLLFNCCFPWDLSRCILRSKIWSVLLAI